MKEFISRKKVLFLTIISILVVITLLYSTYAINVFVSQTTPTTYDMALTFDLSSSVSSQMVVAAGKSKVFDITITNPYNDSVKYGVAYKMVSPTTLPSGLTIAQLDNSKNTVSGTVAKNSTATVSIIIENKSTSSTTVTFSVINGYKNGGDLIVPSGQTLVSGTYTPTAQTSDVTISKFTLPTSGGYTVTPTCTGATATFDYTTKKMKVSAVSSAAASCSPKVSTTTRTTLADYIISLVGTNTSVTSGAGTLAKITVDIDATTNGTKNSTMYRYKGLIPNNYISFNGELWRIIGVFDEVGHGVTGKNLVKIIRNESIGSYLWDEYESHVPSYPYSNVYQILNYAYYNHLDATNEIYCNSYYNTDTDTTIKGVCNFTRIGIQDEYKSMIENNAKWFIGEFESDGDETPEALYITEREIDYGYVQATYARTGSVKTAIGLMSPSDYAYAPSSAISNLFGAGSNSSGPPNVWIKRIPDEWLLGEGANTGDNTPLILNTSGKITTYVNDFVNAAVRPVLYLKGDIYRVSGSGTPASPYIITQ